MNRRWRHTSLIFFLVASASASIPPGCATVPEETRQAAREAVLSVRPDVDLDQVEIGVLSFWNDPRPYMERAQDDLARNRRRIYEENVEFLSRAGLLDERDLEKVGEYFVEIDVVGHSGIAVPSEGVIFLHPDHADSVSVLAHELAHVATERKGYQDKRNERFFLRFGGRPDPRFVDIDAILASKALMEGDAEFSELAAMAYRQGGDAELAELWKKPFPADPPSGVGPLRIQYPDGRVVDLGPGEPYYPRLELVAAFQKIAYEGSLALVQARHREGEPLEETLRRMWAGFSYTTRELLFPGGETPPSRFAGIARGLVGEVSGALRVGSFLTWEMLKKHGGLPRAEATELSGKLQDDLLVRFGEKDFCWVTLWADAASASRFEKLYAGVLQNGKVLAGGQRVVATAGEAVCPPELLQD